MKGFWPPKSHFPKNPSWTEWPTVLMSRLVAQTLCVDQLCRWTVILYSSLSCILWLHTLLGPFILLYRWSVKLSQERVYEKENLNWSEQSACDQQSNLGRPLFFVFYNITPMNCNITLMNSNITPMNCNIILLKNPEVVIIGFRSFAWAPNS